MPRQPTLDITIEDFSGGITDNVFSNNWSQFEDLDNVDITDNGKPKTRMGSALYHASVNRAGTSRLTGLVNYKLDTQLFVTTARVLYKHTGSALTAITGPTGNDAFNVGTTASNLSDAEWKGHLLLANDEGCAPIKVYPDASGTYQARTAGLPAIAETENYVSATALAAGIALANELKSQMILHFDDYSSSRVSAGGDSHSSTLIDGMAPTTNIAVGMHCYAPLTNSVPVTATVLSKTVNSVTLSAAVTATTAGDTFYFAGQHYGQDVTAKALISGVSNASNLPTLLTLTNALIQSYTSHVDDTYPTSDAENSSYYIHHTSLSVPGGAFGYSSYNGFPTVRLDPSLGHAGADLFLTGGSILGNSSVFQGYGTDVFDGYLRDTYAPKPVTTLVEACRALDDLRDKYNLHDRSPMHYAFISIHPVSTAPLIGTVDTGPRVTQDWSDLYTYANALKDVVNDHITNSSQHRATVALSTGITAADATTRELLGELTWQIGYYTWLHLYDASFEHFVITATSANGTPDLTAASSVVGLADGMYLTAANARFTLGAQILSSGVTATTLTMDENATGTTAGLTFDFSYSTNHATKGITALPSIWSLFDLSSPHSVLAFLSACQTAIDAHMKEASIHTSAYTAGVVPSDYVSISEVPVAQSYLYSLLYRYDYSVGTISHIDRGPVTTRSLETAQLQSNPRAISLIPTLSNGSTLNYDTTAIDVEIYRTDDTGTTYYLLSTIDNGTTTYTDSTSDVTLVNNELLYTAGGVVENDPPPTTAKCVHIAADTAYYGNITDAALSPHTSVSGDSHASTLIDGIASTANIKVGDVISGTGVTPGTTVVSTAATSIVISAATSGSTSTIFSFTSTEVLPNRIRQAIVGDIDSCPATFYVDLDEAVVGISSTHKNVLGLSAVSVYRLTGRFDLRGQGGIVVDEKLSTDMGLVSESSIVRTEQGVFFAGTNGFYFTDGYQLIPLSEEFNTTYKAITSTAAKAAKIKGVFDSKNKRIIWAACTASGATECDGFFVLHLNFGVKRNACFTTYSLTSDQATAVCMFSGDLVRGNSTGYLFKHSSSYTSDTNSAGVDQTIIHTIKTVCSNFGNEKVRKYGQGVMVKAENEGNLSLAISSNNDRDRNISSLTPIKSRSNYTWGDPLIFWGDPELYWNSDSLIEEERRFPANSLRFSVKQLTLTNDYMSVWWVQSADLVTVNGTANTVTWVDTTTYDWPTNFVGYKIAFEDDNYVREYPITIRTADTLTFTDTGNNAPTGNYGFVVRGYPKGEVLHLLALQINYMLLTQSKIPFQGGSQGAV